MKRQSLFGLILIIGLLLLMLGLLTPLPSKIFGGLGVVCITLSIVLNIFIRKRD